MSFIKHFTLLLLLLFCVGTVFSGTQEFKSSSLEKWNLSLIGGTDPSYDIESITRDYGEQIGDYTASFDNSLHNYGFFLIAPESADFVLTAYQQDLSLIATGGLSYDLNFAGYYSQGSFPVVETDLSNNFCQASYFSGSPQNPVITSNLQPLKREGKVFKFFSTSSTSLHEAESTLGGGFPPELRSVLQKNYYMKAFAFMTVENTFSGEMYYVLPKNIHPDSPSKPKFYNSPYWKTHISNEYGFNFDSTTSTFISISGNVEQLDRYEDIFLLPPVGTGGTLNPNQDVPYVLLKPGQTKLDFNYDYESMLADGIYKRTLYVVPIDGKCDIDGSPGIEIKSMKEYLPNIVKEVVSDSSGFKLEKDDKHMKVTFKESGNITIAGYLPSSAYFKKEIDFTNPRKRPNFAHGPKTPYTGPQIAKMAHMIQRVSMNHNPEDLFYDLQANVKTFNNLELSMQRKKGSGSAKHYSIQLHNLSAYDPDQAFYIYFKEHIHFKDIVFDSSVPITLLYQDLDPIIGWKFNSTPGTVNVTLPDGSPIVITVIDQPIIFNGGNITVNYRNGTCHPLEINLFNISNFVHGQIDSTGPYKVCLSSISYLNIFRNYCEI